MKKTYLILIIMCVCMLTACQNKRLGTSLEFSFNANEKSSEYDEKTIYIDESKDKVELDTTLVMDSGQVSIQVVSTNDGTVIWENLYEQSGAFSIVLNDLEDDSEYVIKIQTVNTEKASITMTSADDLVKDKDKPTK